MAGTGPRIVGSGSMAVNAPSSGRKKAGLLSAAFVLGIGLGGFFDGILLHQVLQWHHLLSLVPGEAFRDIGTQILADGLFHVLMYLVTAAGLWMLWRRRAALGEAGAAGRVFGGALLGFGAWNVIDVGFFHWVLVIHRIRVGVPNPMLYDVGWLLLFGALPLLAALLPLRRGGGTGGHQAGSGEAGGHGAAAALGLLAVSAASLASLPVPGSNTALVILKPGSKPAGAINAALAAGAPILWMDARRGLLAVRTGEGSEFGFYKAGALLVTRSPALAGCFAASRA
jgi:uncharacterized membrane protein